MTNTDRVIPYTINQEGTLVPENLAKTVIPAVEEFDDGKIFISLVDGWVTVDIKNRTYAVGAYEG